MEGGCAAAHGGRQDLITALSVRFSALPEELLAQVHQVKDQERLDALFRRALVVEDLETYARELAESL